MELVCNKELLKEFDVEGSFYRVEINNIIFECRSQARIRRKSVNINNYDAVVVMVNPGSCNPSDQKSKILVIDSRNEIIPFVRAESDPTIWQIMRLMKLKNWNQVNIINLSDLCTGNIEFFKEQLKKAKNLCFNHQSIFSIEREQELKEIMDANKGPVIFSWGTSPFIKEFAEKVQKYPMLRGNIGWKHKKSNFYYHPNQRLEKYKKEWLIRINEQINKYEQEHPVLK